MDGSSHSDGDVELDLEVIVAPDVPTARKRGPAYLVGSVMVGGRTRITSAPLVNPLSSGSSVANMREE